MTSIPCSYLYFMASILPFPSLFLPLFVRALISCRPFTESRSINYQCEVERIDVVSYPVSVEQGGGGASLAGGGGLYSNLHDKEGVGGTSRGRYSTGHQAA